MAYVSQMAPYTANTILPLLATSAVAAGKSCSGDTASMTCSIQWTLGTYDGKPRAVGQQLSLFNVLNANLIKFVEAPPVTQNTGGTSQGNPNAGTTGNPKIGTVSPPTTGDKAFAGALTGIFGILIGVGGWMMLS
jgi:mannan endo-1,6-alpha-mannosidase